MSSEIGAAGTRRIGFIPENRMQGEDVTNDVRGYTRRKFIGKILKWSAEEQSAIERGEECLRREIREELAEDTTIMPTDRKIVVSGKSVSVRVDLGGRRSNNKKNTYLTLYTHTI